VDATLRNRILLSLGLLVAVILAFSFEARATHDTEERLALLRDTTINPQAARAKATQRDLIMHRVSRGFQDTLDKDAKTYGLQPTTPEELGKPNKYIKLVEENVGVKIGQSWDSDWIQVKAVTQKVAYMRTGAEIRANHSLAVVENVHDTPIAYFIDVRSADRGGCEVRGARKHNANALLPGERAEIAVCAGSKPIEIHRLEAMELTALGYNYVSMIPPRGMGYDETTAQSHRAGRRHKVCTQIPSERLAGALREETVAWRDVVDFFSRHNCHRYSWLWAYRFAEQGGKKLPVERRHLEGDGAGDEPEGVAESSGG
jgi:hypothetical protein